MKQITTHINNINYNNKERPMTTPTRETKTQWLIDVGLLRPDEIDICDILREINAVVDAAMDGEDRRYALHITGSQFSKVMVALNEATQIASGRQYVLQEVGDSTAYTKQTKQREIAAVMYEAGFLPRHALELAAVVAYKMCDTYPMTKVDELTLVVRGRNVKPVKAAA